MLSSLPKLLDRTFIIGFFLPALLTTMMVAWTFPSLEILAPLRNLSASDKNLSDLTYIILIVSALAIVLLTTNNLQYRFLEGYLPPISWCTPLLRWQQGRFSRLTSEHDRLQQTKKDNGNTLPPKDWITLGKLKRKLLAQFPLSVETVLPTRFGNTVRAFESYPFRVYGADAVPIWPRLTSVISKEFAAQLDDARTRVDFLVNLTCLGGLVSLAALCRALLGIDWTCDLVSAFRDLPGTREVHASLVGVAVAILAYRWAIIQAAAWGDLVKSAFDCYLPALIKQLGYSIPALWSDRVKFWDDFNHLIVYQQPMATQWPVPPAAATHSEGDSRSGAT